MSSYAVVLGGGSGKRMGAGQNKVFLPVGGVPAIIRSIRAFQGLCRGAVAVIASGEESQLKALIEQYGLSSFVLAIVPGGKERQDSVWNGLNALPDDAQYVLIHDGARALVTEQVIRDSLKSAQQHGSGVAAVPVVDTIKRAAADGRVLETPDRASLYAMQTPQTFRLSLIRQAHAIARQDGFLGTDDASLLEHAALPVYLSMGQRENLKLTTPVDLALAELILQQREKEKQP